MTFTYPLARYRFEFEVTTQIRLPEYAGSALRGAFGHALRQISCVTRAKTCAGCILVSKCPYTGIFEPQKPEISSISLSTPPVPYIIEPPEWGERHYAPGELLAFHFTLVGRAADHLPLCITAWRRALTRGIGRGDGTAELTEVAHESSSTRTTVYSPGGDVSEHHCLLTLPDESAPQTLTLEFLTPLRLQENGYALPPARLTPRPLLTALVRRASLLAEHYHGKMLMPQSRFAELAQEASAIEGNTQLRWRDWTRCSSRQQKSMKLGGCIGLWSLSGNLAPFWDFLRLGERLHVGKEASFGLGQYRILTSIPAKFVSMARLP